MTGGAELLKVFGRKRFTVADTGTAQVDVYFTVCFRVKRERSAMMRALVVDVAAVVNTQEATKAGFLGQKSILAADLVAAT